MKFYIVDAFADELFGGNAAGVVILEKEEKYPSEDIMIKTAAELKYSETAFIKQIAENEFKIRYFTPAAEVELCGHATIGSFGALVDCGLAKNHETYMIDTLSGKKEVMIKDQLVMMDMSAPVELDKIIDGNKLEELAKIMGIEVEDIGMMPQMISTGLPDIMLHVKNKEILMNINPDFPALSELSDRYKVVGVHAFALNLNNQSPEEKKITAFCRNFAPLYEIDEEAATGTSNGALTYYLFKNDIIKENEENLFLQGESMNRPSKISSILETTTYKDETTVQIKIGGMYRILSKGDIFLI